MTSTRRVKSVFAFATLNLVGALVAAVVAFYGSAILISQGDISEADSASNLSLRMPFAFCGGSSLISIDSYFASSSCLPLPGIA